MLIVPAMDLTTFFSLAAAAFKPENDILQVGALKRGLGRLNRFIFPFCKCSPLT